MTTNLGGAARLRAAINARLTDTTTGRRSLRWLAERSGIPYATLQDKIRNRPGKLTADELFAIADAFDVELADLDTDAAA